MTNIVDKPTRNMNILDLILTSNDNIVNNCEILEMNMSDHEMVLADLNISKTIDDNQRRVNHCMTDFVTYNIEDATDEQIDDFNNLLMNIDYEFMSSLDNNAQVDFMYKVLQDAAGKVFNVKEAFKDKNDENRRKRFIPKDVRNLLRRKIKLNKKVLSKDKWWENLKIQEEIFLLLAHMKRNILIYHFIYK